MRNTTPHDASTSLLPGVAEGDVHLHCLERRKDAFRSRHHLHRLVDAVKARATRAACDGSLDTTLTGVARGVLVLRSKLVVSTSQIAAGKTIAAQMVQAHANAKQLADVARNAGDVSEFESVTLLAKEPLHPQPEPFATPSSNLTLGIEMRLVARRLVLAARGGERHLQRPRDGSPPPLPVRNQLHLAARASSAAIFSTIAAAASIFLYHCLKATQTPVGVKAG